MFSLTRMKTLSPFVRKHFSSKPWLISLSFFITCFFVELPFAFTFEVQSFGIYFYYDLNGYRQSGYFFYLTSSKFSFTLFGQLLLAFTTLFLNVVLTLVVGIALNIISVCQYKSYLNERRPRDEERFRISFNNTQASTVQIEKEVQKRKQHNLTPKEIDDRKAEKNKFYMALTLCSISVLSRLIFILCYIYAFYYYTFSNTLIVFVSSYCIVPTCSILFFYFFRRGQPANPT